MRQTYFVLLSLALLTPMACCQQHAQNPQTRPLEHQLTTTPVAPVAAQQEGHRLSPELKLVMGLQEEFFAKEGPTKRGPRFEKLLGGVELLRRRWHLSETEILLLLGQPDYGVSDRRGALFLYRYDRFGNRDWYVRIDIAPSGKVTRVGFNASTEIDFGAYPKFNLSGD